LLGCFAFDGSCWIYASVSWWFWNYVDRVLLHEMVDVFLFHGFVWLMVFSGCSI
jgi:hypothetical protein